MVPECWCVVSGQVEVGVESVAPIGNEVLCLLNLVQTSWFDPSSKLFLHLLSPLQVQYAFYHAPNPGPTRWPDPNRFPGRETQDWDSLPDFFFKTELASVGMAHIL